MERYSLPNKLPFSSKKLQRKVVASYIFDYVIILVLAAAFFALDAVEPFHQEFSLRNYTLRYPYAVHERVPIPLLLTVTILAPGSIIAVYTLIIDGLFSHQAEGRRKSYTLKSRLWELNCGILGLLLANGLAFVITGALKNAIGKPRPDLIARCIPRETDANLALTPGNYSLVDHAICTQMDNSILKDGFRSFPSGHSSSSFSGLFYLSLYLAGKLHFLDSKGEVWKVFVVVIPTIGAALVAGSRIMDARHHPFDVITGSMLGIAMAWISYRQYFPSLSNFKAKGRAYPIRTWGRIGEEYAQLDKEARQDPLATVGFVSGRDSPRQSNSGNVFRDEIHTSQRKRRQGEEFGPAVSSEASIRPSVGLQSRHYGSGAYHHRDTWEDSSDEDTHDLELQPTYTLSQQTRAAHYDPPPAHIAMREETYSAYKPPSQAQPDPVSPLQGDVDLPNLPSSNPLKSQQPTSKIISQS